MTSTARTDVASNENGGPSRTSARHRPTQPRRRPPRNARGVAASFLGLAALLAAAPAAAHWTPTTFQVGGYLSLAPHGGVRDVRRLLLANGAGLDWIIAQDQRNVRGVRGYDVAGFRTLLDSLRQAPDFHLRAILRDEPLGALDAPHLFEYAHDVPARTWVAERLSPANGLDPGPSALGWDVWDEPLDGPTMRRAVATARELDAQPSAAGGLAFTNLCGIEAFSGANNPRASAFGVNAAGDPERAYRAYLDAFLAPFDSTAAPAPLVSFDEYPFQYERGDLRGWFGALRIVREAAAAHGRGGQAVPFWTIVQLSPYASGQPPCGELNSADTTYRADFGFAETRWQVWTAVAYGAKGIGYWLLGEGRNRCEIWGPGLWSGADADTSAASGRYSQVRALDAELHTLGPVLMKCDPVGVVHADSLGWPFLTPELASNPSRASRMVAGFGVADSEAMAGELRDRASGARYVLVVNKSRTGPRTFTVRFAEAPTAVWRVNRASGHESPAAISGSSLRVVDLPPGTGELYRVVLPAQ